MRTLAIILMIILLLTTSTSAAYGPTTGTPETAEEPPTKNTARPCDDLATIYERISCRINLPETQEYNYLPEECRNIGGTTGDQCITRYKQLQSCFTTKDYDVQISCARKKLAWTTTTVKKEAAFCKTAENFATCKQVLIEKTYNLIKFRIYILEQHINDLYKEGNITEQQATKIITTLEITKQQFNQATTIPAKKAVLAAAQEALKKFKTEVQP
ncbi:MAG: hypothetical protein Q7R96_01260 [Nanoarchaeota archaeon]|nr:hypothetical protein [Nanoarchaeota archaeon]